MSLAASLLIPPLALWAGLVSKASPEPYLDEAFHVPQAQRYCAGDWRSWDPKITTPPGLYLLSLPLNAVLGCDVRALRAVNVICTAVLAFCIENIYSTCLHASRQNGAEHKPGDSRWLAAHNALNVTLFPPLFFFSALYYTDVPSTLSVVAFHLYFVYSTARRTPWWLRLVILYLLGAVSLSFRQTNIFWVAVFPAAVVMVEYLDQSHEIVKHSMHKKTKGFGDSLINVAKTSWNTNVVYDPRLTEANYFLCILSVATCLLKIAAHPERLLHLLRALSPFLSLLASFVAFVYWNGSVVLGDKANHVATVHLPQMLYIWPYLVFFSWPLIYQHLLVMPLALFAWLPSVSHLEKMLVFTRRVRLPQLRYMIVFGVLAAAAVKWNTIVHPFTLADNRHYTFYVFRRLTRPGWIRYAAIAIYATSAWACIQVLGSTPTPPNPLLVRDAAEDPAEDPAATTPPALPLPDTKHAASVSFVLIWLATSAMHLVSAPLVEPRYFILPWLFWRLHVPLKQPGRPGNVAASFRARAFHALWTRNDLRLWLETAWFLAVNAATGYVFLNWEFEWPSEPGRVQRFMW